MFYLQLEEYQEYLQLRNDLFMEMSRNGLRLVTLNATAPAPPCSRMDHGFSVLRSIVGIASSKTK